MRAARFWWSRRWARWPMPASRLSNDVCALQGSGGAGGGPVGRCSPPARLLRPRQRFDVVLNNLAGCAYTTGEIRVTSDGTPWRPLVHVEDICEGILCALEAPREAVSAEAFNVGDDAQNYRVSEIAE